MRVRWKREKGWVLQEETAYLAARQLAEVRFQILSDDSIDGHKAKYTRLSYTALRVIITLQKRAKDHQNKQGPS